MSLDYTETENPVGFESDITGPQGARFVLHPVKGVHTKEDLESAVKYIRRNRDVVHLSVEWDKATEDNIDPEKIPDFLIIKGLRVELGKKEAYITELEDKLKERTSVESQELSKSIKSEEAYRKIKADNTKLKKENLNLRKTISELISNNQKT
jgi:hemerythrin-like domain-containing protein